MAGRSEMDQGGQLGKGPLSQQKDALIIIFLVTVTKHWTDEAVGFTLSQS